MRVLVRILAGIVPAAAAVGALVPSAVAGPAFTVTPAGLDFGNQTIGNYSPVQSFTVRNTGDVNLTLVGAGHGAFFTSPTGDPGNCFPVGAPLPPGQSCTWSFRFHPLEAKRYDDTWRLTTNAGEVTRTLTGVGGTPVSTRIDSGPGSPTTTEQPATFRWSTIPFGLKSECSLDGAAYAPCSSPRTYNGIQPDVMHTFRVRAIRNDGTRDPFPASWYWRYIPLKPGTKVGMLDLSGHSATLTFMATVGDSETPEPGDLFECMLAGPSAYSFGWNQCSPMLVMHGLATGSYQFFVRAKRGAQTDETPAEVDFAVG